MALRHERVVDKFLLEVCNRFLDVCVFRNVKMLNQEVGDFVLLCKSGDLCCTFIGRFLGFECRVLRFKSIDTLDRKSVV